MRERERERERGEKEREREFFSINEEQTKVCWYNIVSRSKEEDPKTKE